MSCLFYCCTKRTYFYAFLFLYRFFGNSSDHGMISSSKSAVSLFPVILVSISAKYSCSYARRQEKANRGVKRNLW